MNEITVQGPKMEAALRARQETIRLTSPAVVGPGTLMHLREALIADWGYELAQDVFNGAGCRRWLTEDPPGMIPEQLALQLFRSVWSVLGEYEAAKITRQAGELTAQDIISHRMPPYACFTLKALPRAASLRLLLHGIVENAWTFCGSGECHIELGKAPAIVIQNNPLSLPHCQWHAAVFTRLIREFVSRAASVDETHCSGNGEHVCRFEITFQ